MSDLVKGLSKPVSNTIFSAGTTGSGKPEDDKGKQGSESNKKIYLKEFFWDQFLIYLATAIGLLTLLDVSIQFFHSNRGLQCYIPLSIFDEEMTRDNAAFVNTYCVSSLTWGEYYSLFILLQGILMVAPHYLWASVFTGRFDFFVDLVQQLDRLRDSNTGDYRPKNIEIVKKLEKEFPENLKLLGIFSLYVGKLMAQLMLIVASIVINVTIFPETDFKHTFLCPRNFNESTPPPLGWLLPVAVPCSYPSFRILSKLLIVDYILLILSFGSALYGIIWCVKRHPSSLGYKRVAEFAFSACLPPDEYVPHSVWRNPKKFFTPRICNDLDFLIMRLFRADSGHGRVFKDIQVSKEIKGLVTQDHVLLHLYNDAIQDQWRRRATSRSNAEGGITGREKDIRDHFFNAGFNPRSEVEIYEHMMGDKRLGNMTFESKGGLRDHLFGFFQFTAKNDVAYDISFGTVGCQLILARGFKEVLSVNFHPFYRNPREVVKKELFQVNYCSVLLQDDIFSQKTDNLRLSDEVIDDELNVRDPETGALSHSKKIYFAVVGPFVKESTKGTVNLHIERMNTGRYFGKDAVLLALRPIKIAGTDVENHFCKYEPAKELFEIKTIPSELIQGAPDLCSGPLDSVTLSVTCGDVDCLFEFVMYAFTGCQEDDELIPYDSGSPTPSNNSAPNRSQAGLLDPESLQPVNRRQSSPQLLSRSSPSRRSSDLILLSPPAARDNRNIARQRESAVNPLSIGSSPPNESGSNNNQVLNNERAVSHNGTSISSASITTAV